MFPEDFSKKLDRKKQIINASIELTYRCNQRCLHCYQPDALRAFPEMSCTEIKRIIDELAEAGCLFMALTGGEPLLREDFWEIAEHAHKRNFAVSLQTNGLLVDEEAAAKIKALNFLQVHISLLGADGATHDSITGVEGSFVRIMESVRHLRVRGVAVLLKVTLLKENVGQLERMDELIKELDCLPVFSPNVFACTDCTTGPLSHRVTDEQLADMFCYMRKKEDFREEVSLKVDRELPLCRGGFTSCAITPNGIVTPCVGFPLELGDLKKQSFADVWRGDGRLKDLRSLRVSDMRECAGCELESSCIRCPGMAYLETGDIRKPSHENCRVSRAIQCIS